MCSAQLIVGNRVAIVLERVWRRTAYVMARKMGICSNSVHAISCAIVPYSSRTKSRLLG